MDRQDWRRITRVLSERDCNRSDTIPPRTRKQLEQKHGAVWDSFTLARDFEIEAFTDRCVVAVRRDDGVRGTFQFQWKPRYYWGFEAVK